MSLPPLVLPEEQTEPEEQAEQSADGVRYSRQRILPGFGTDGQLRLASAQVLVVGAGGLGSPVLQYLAAAGVGTVGVVDDDVVEVSNLQRQIIHDVSALGESKTSSASRSIAALNPEVRVLQHGERLSSANAVELFGRYDLVVDASDNFATRYLIADAAALTGKPCVWGSVLRFDGQVSVFWEDAPDGLGIGYRDVFPEPPEASTVLDCAEAGVLGSVCATVGSLMATEVIKLITGLGDSLLGRVLVLDALTASQREIAVVRDPERRPVTELIDYDAWCGTAPPAPAAVIEVEELATLLRSQDASGLLVLDVREDWERAAGTIEGDRHLPLGRLLAEPSAVPGVDAVVVYCASGVRSASAVAALRQSGRSARSLAGGFAAWQSVAHCS